VRNGRRVSNRNHPNAGIRNGPDRGFATTTRSFDPNLALLHSGLVRFLRGLIRGLLRCEGSSLARTAKTPGTRGRLRYQIALQVGNRNHRVIERRCDVRNTNRQFFIFDFRFLITLVSGNQKS
jgi:hypothetical protein